MNIQSINQNRQQNFGMNFKVVAPEAEIAIAKAAANEVLTGINRYVSPEVRGKLTLAMRDVGDTTVFMHKAGTYNGFILNTSANPQPTGLPMTTIGNPEVMAHITDKPVRNQADKEAGYLLSFLREVRLVPKTAQTEEALAKEISVIG